MNNSSLERLYWIAQIGLALVALVTLILAAGQIRAFKLFEMLKFIESEQIRKSRRIVLREIYRRKDEVWYACRPGKVSSVSQTTKPKYLYCLHTAGWAGAPICRDGFESTASAQLVPRGCFSAILNPFQHQHHLQCDRRADSSIRFRFPTLFPFSD